MVDRWKLWPRFIRVSNQLSLCLSGKCNWSGFKSESRDASWNRDESRTSFIDEVLTDFTNDTDSGTITFSDNFLDTELETNPILEFDNFQPFPVLDTPKSGVVNVSGTTVSWVSGDQFNTNWAPGSIIVIGSTAYTLYTSPSFALTLELNESAGTHTSVKYTINNATAVASLMVDLMFSLPTQLMSLIEILIIAREHLIS